MCTGYMISIGHCVLLLQNVSAGDILCSDDYRKKTKSKIKREIGWLLRNGLEL